MRTIVPPDATGHVPDEPLPQTFAFVIAIGCAILVGWFAMFALLVSRW